MLLKPKNLPMQNGGFPWGAVIIAAVIIGGGLYVGYQVMKPIEPIVSPDKTKENERG